MAQRFYFPSDTAAEVLPAVNGAWTQSEAQARKLVHTTKSGTPLAEGTIIGPNNTGVLALDRIYVSRPLEGAHTISGTVKGYLMQREVAAADNAKNRLEIYVVSRDGQTVRGTCLAIGQYGPDVELNTALRNKALCDGDTISSVSAQDGDRIVVKIGYGDSAGATVEAASLYGDPTSGTDLAENETNTTNNPGWIEFSANMTFEAEDNSNPVLVQAVTAGSADAQVTSLTITPKTTPVVGNLLIIIFNPDKQPTGWTAPSGFSTLPESISWTNAETTCTVYYKIANGTNESSFNFGTWTTAVRPTATLLEYSGVHATTPIDDTAFSASATTSTTRSAISVTPSTTMSGVAVFFATTDSILSITSGGYAWTTGTSQPPDRVIATYPTASPGNAALEVVEKRFTNSNAAINLGCTYSGTADGGGIGAFIIRAAAAGGAMTANTINGVATASGTLTGSGALASTVAGAATTTGTLTASGRLIGSAAGTTPTAELTNDPGRMTANTINGTATTTAQLRGAGALVGSSAGSTIAQVLNINMSAAGTATATATISKLTTGGTPTFVKKGTAANGNVNQAANTAFNVTFDGGTGASAGNLIIAAFIPDKNAGTITGPSGFTQIYNAANTDLSWWIGYKIAAGGEGATGSPIAAQWTGTGSKAGAVIAEFSGVAAASTLDKSPAVTYNATASAGPWTTPSDTNTNANGLAISIFGVDTRITGWGENHTHGAGWTERAVGGTINFVTSTDFDGNAGCAVSTRVLASAGTSTSDTLTRGTQVSGGPSLATDQVLAALVIFNGGGGNQWESLMGASTAGSSTTTGSLAGSRGALAGTIAGTSTTNLQGTPGGMSASTAGAATTTAQLRGAGVLAGSSAGVATTTLTVAPTEATARVTHVTHLRPVAETAPSLRVFAGAMTHNSAVISCHAPTSGTVTAHIYNESTHAKVGTFTGSASGDNWVKVSCTGLSPFTQYYALVEFGARQHKQRFKTYQTPGSAQSFTFAAISCTASDSTAESFARVKAKNADYLYNLGDMHYTDSGNGTAESVYLGEFDAVLQNATQMNMYSHYGFEYVWSDHDYGNPNNSTNTSRPNAISAFKKAIPHTTLPFTGSTDPICRSWVNGRVRFIMTDTRSQRVVGTTFMGSTQKQWFKDQVTAAKLAGQYIIWLAEHNYNGGGAGSVGSDDGYDTLTAERQELANFLKAIGVTGSSARFMIVHGDAHMIAIDDGTHSENDYATGGGANGIKIIAVGGLDRTGSAKGGPYSASGDTTNFHAPATTRHYGVVTVTDTGGSTLEINLRCYDENDAHNTTVKELTFTTAALTATTLTAAGTSTTTGTLTDLPGPMTGSTAGVATTTAQLQGTGALAGSVAGAGTTSGAVTGSGALVGSATGAATTQLVPSIRGTTAGSATTSATLTGTGAVAGSVAGVATTTATLTGSVQAVGLAAGAATTTGQLLGAGALAATAVGAATTSGTLLGAGQLVGSSTGAAATTATPTIRGTTAGAATTAATLTGSGALGTGTSAGAATTTATLLGIIAAVGSAAGAATTTAQLRGTGVLISTVAGSTTASAALQGTGALAGTTAGSATTLATPTIRGTAAGVATATATPAIRGTTAGVATVTAQLRGTGALAATAAGTSTPAATLVGSGRLIGSTAGSATATASTDGTAFMVGTSAGAASTTAALLGAGALAGTTVGAATTTATPTIRGTTAGTATVSAALAGQGALAGTVAGATTTTATLSGGSGTTATAAGAATVTGMLVGAGVLAATAAGTTTSSAQLRGAGRLIGTTTGTSTATASAGGESLMVGTAAGVANTSAGLAGTGALSGTVGASATLTAQLRGAGALAGNVAAAASATASAQGFAVATGTASGVATVLTAALSGFGRLLGTASAAASTAGALLGHGILAGAAAGTATLSGTLAQTLLASGSTAGTSSTTGQLGNLKLMVGSAAASSTASVNSDPPGQRAASAAGTSSAIATLRGVAHCVAFANGTSTTAATMTGIAFLSASSDSLGTASALLTGFAVAVGPAAGAAPAAGILRGAGALAGLAAAGAAGTGAMTARGQLVGQSSSSSTQTANLTHDPAAARGAANGTSTATASIRGHAAISGTSYGKSIAFVITPKILPAWLDREGSWPERSDTWHPTMSQRINRFRMGKTNGKKWYG